MDCPARAVVTEALLDFARSARDRNAFGLVLGGALTALLVGSGCMQDFEQFRPTGNGGSGTGGGGGDVCAGVDCNDDNPCTDDICDVEGKCLHPAAEVFTVPQTPGDCKNATCQGTMVVSQADPMDLPTDDGNPCHAPACNGDTPAHPNLPDDTACNGNGVCAGGVCSACTAPAQCGTDTACVSYACTNNTCVPTYSPGTVVSGANDGDCVALQCVDMMSDPQSLPLDSDVMDDGNVCTSDSCNAGTPVHAPAGAGTACDDGAASAGGQCDAGTTCVDCTSDGGCGGATPSCKVATNSCVECTVNGNCSAPTGVCDTATNNCVGCTSNGNCSAPTPACDMATQTCVGCTANANCAAPTPVCKVANHTCVACTANSDCGGLTPTCDLATNTCVQCTANAQCSGLTPVCKMSTHTCVECTADANCTPDRCDTTTNTCKECLGNADCAAPTPVCDIAGGGTCEECVGNADCAGNLDGPTCTANLCGCTGDPQCVGNAQGLKCRSGACGCNNSGDCTAPAMCNASNVCM